MTLTMLSSIVVICLLVPSVSFKRKLAKAGVRKSDTIAYFLIAIFGIWTISIIITYAGLLYIGWKADALPMPGTDITETIDMLRSQTQYSILFALIAVISWYTGIPYKSLRRIDLENNIGTETLERAREAWQPAMLFCGILHLAGIYGSIALILFLRITVT